MTDPVVHNSMRNDSLSEDDSLSSIAHEECLGLLSAHNVGRLCVLHENYPLIFPVNYRVAPDGDGGAAIVLRTRPGSAFDHDGVHAAFQIDGIDHLTETGWSVLIRGALHHASHPVPASCSSTGIPDPGSDRARRGWCSP